jgi:hypothetical protein
VKRAKDVEVILSKNDFSEESKKVMKLIILIIINEYFFKTIQELL